MNGLEEAFMTLSAGLKTLAEGINVISKQVDQLANNSTSALAKSMAEQTPKKSPTTKSIQNKKSVARETTSKKREDNRTASDIVYELVKNSDSGANYAYIMEKTGFKRKKVANIFFNLKRQGKIKSVDKGVYTHS